MKKQSTLAIKKNKSKYTQFKKGYIPWNKGKKNVMPTPWNKGKVLLGDKIHEKRVCYYCGKKYGYKKNSHNKWIISKKFCSAKCRDNFFASMKQSKKCINCGKSYFDRMSGKRKYCSLKCYWSALSKMHPKNDSNYNYIKVGESKRLLHRVVMEKHIGRKLEKQEIVHHIDGNRANNNIKNLEILTQAEHIKKHFQNRHP